MKKSPSLFNLTAGDKIYIQVIPKLENGTIAIEACHVAASAFTPETIRSIAKSLKKMADAVDAAEKSDA